MTKQSAFANRDRGWGEGALASYIFDVCNGDDAQVGWYKHRKRKMISIHHQLFAHSVS